VAQAGAPFKALDQTFPVTVTNGTIAIEFINGSVDYPKVSAIEITQGTGSQVAMPTFLPAAGTYLAAQAVTISDTTAGAVIYYTTDGSTPSTSSTLYNGTAITVSSTTTVKATATASGMINSAIATATYTIGSGTFAPFLVHAGGPAYTDSVGQTWGADTDLSGGDTYSTTNSISNTPDPSLYQTERYGVFSYDFSVPNGNYNVLLKFAEIYWTSPGQRIFSVSINGTPVLTNFDIIAAAGAPLTAIDKAFPVSVTGGNIQIQFIQGSADLPKVSDIEIE